MADLTILPGVSYQRVGRLAVTATGGVFSGSLSVHGPEASSFAITGDSLYAIAPLAAGNHYVNIVATQAGATGSPFSQTFVMYADPSLTPSIDSIHLSATSFVSGTSGLTVGTVSVSMSGASFSGTLMLGGTDAAQFSLTGNTLTTASSVAMGTYSITITADQTGATSRTTSFSLHATTTLNSVVLSNTSVASGTSGATVGTISVNSTGSFTGTLSVTGTDASKFTISGTSLNTAVALTDGTYSIGVRATQSGAVNSPKTTSYTITAGTDATTFSDEFTTLSLWDASNPSAGGTWQPSFWYAPDGMTQNACWVLNPFNSSTPISGVYTASGGMAHLSLIETPSDLSDACDGQAYVGNTIQTSPSFRQTHGYFEAKFSWSPVAGADPAFFLMTDAGWPPEIDILEAIYDGSEWIGKITVWSMDGTIAAERYNYDAEWNLVPYDPSVMHTYGVDWQPDFLRFYVDRVLVLETPTPAGYGAPLFPILQLVAGDGTWGTDITDPTLLPATLTIDYVKVWSAKPF